MIGLLKSTSTYIICTYDGTLEGVSAWRTWSIHGLENRHDSFAPTKSTSFLVRLTLGAGIIYLHYHALSRGLHGQHKVSETGNNRLTTMLFPHLWINHHHVTTFLVRFAVGSSECEDPAACRSRQFKNMEHITFYSSHISRRWQIGIHGQSWFP